MVMTEEELRAEEEPKAAEDAEAKEAAEKEAAETQAAEEAAKTEEEARKKEFKPDAEAAYRRTQEENRALREQNQQILNRLNNIERQARNPIDSKELDETFGEGATAKLNKKFSEIAIRAMTPFLKPLYQNSVETRKEQLRAENPKLWAQVEAEVSNRIARIAASGIEPISQDVDNSYDSAVGRLARTGKLSQKPRVEREVVGEVRHNSPGDMRPARKPVITSEIKKEAVRLGVTEESAAEILENRKKLQTIKK